MNRSGRTGVEILGIVAVTAVLCLISYYAGGALGKSFVSVQDGITFTVWQAHYQKLVMAMGVVAGFLLLAWYLLARFVLTVNDAFDGGKRMIWLIFGFLTLVACFVVPYAYAAIDHRLKIGMSIPVLFLALFGLLGYWGGSILTTPAPYKYTPLLAEKIRAPKNGK